MSVKNKMGFRDTISWYNQNAAQYAKAIVDFGDRQQIDEFVKLLPAGARVLDAGCAAGRDSHLLQLTGLQVVGIDLSTELLRIARKELPQIEFVEGSFLELPFSDKSFDGVWAHASLLHLETATEVQTALTEFNRVLNPKGVLHVLVKAMTEGKKTAVIRDKLSEHDRFFQFFTISEVTKLLALSGFELIKIEQYRETDRNLRGRAEVEWILALGRKQVD